MCVCVARVSGLAETELAGTGKPIERRSRAARTSSKLIECYSLAYAFRRPADPGAGRTAFSFLRRLFVCARWLDLRCMLHTRAQCRASTPTLGSAGRVFACVEFIATIVFTYGECARPRHLPCSRLSPSLRPATRTSCVRPRRQTKWKFKQSNNAS